MQLHQLLRLIHADIPIIFFDLGGHELFYVSEKSQIHVDYYEYEIYSLDTGPSKTPNRKTALYITLIK